jgi:hypothetical protein
MAIRKFRTGQQTYDVSTYVGTYGTIFYDEANGALRISDGVTLGGNPIGYPLASTTQIGGIKLGPGVALNSEGQIVIDSEGLDFNFGDFEAITGFYSDSTAYALLSSTNVDEDIVIASNGTGDIKVVGGFEVYATNGSVTGSLEDAEPFFRILDDGQVRILVPLADTVEGGLEIIGSELGTALAPGQAGTMLHLTGNADLPTRVYHDTLGDYGSYVFRRYNGSVVTPTQVLANEDIARFNWTAATNAGMGSVATVQIRVTALENQTTTAQGSKIVFTVTPVGSPASARVDVATISTADGVSATKFTGPLTGNVTGNVSGTAATVTTAAQPAITSVGTLTSLTVTNAISGGSVSDSIGNVRSVPINGQSGAYNLAATDNGKMISITTGGVSVLQNVFADPYGQIISIYNNSNTSQTITQGAGVTLRLAGTAATGNRTLARYGVATITCVAANTFVISGAGIT